MPIEREFWLPIILEDFIPDDSFMSESVNVSDSVENNILHLVEAGVEPNVLIDNAVFPIPVAERTDNPLEIVLRTLDTENTVVRNVEAMQAAFGKMESVVRGHRNALRRKAALLAAFNWSPAQNTANTPVLATSGAVNKAGFKAMTFDDIIDLEGKYNDLDTPLNARVLVLCPQHRADLQSEDKKLYKEMMSGKALFGFKLYMYSGIPKYDCTTGIKQAFGSIANANSAPASFSFLNTEVCRALGDTEMFVTFKSPTERGDIVGFQQRFTALPFRNKYMGAVYSKK